MRKIIIFLSIISLFYNNFSYSAEKFNKYSLIEAVKSNSLIRTKKYLNGDYKINLKDSYKNTALSYAIYNQNYEISRLLLKNGANPKIKDSTGKMVYCSAKTSDDYKIRKLFEDYDEDGCSKKAVKKRQNKEKAIAVNDEGGFWNWKTIGSAAIGVGGIAILASNGSSGGDSGSDGSGNKFSPADRNYGVVGEVNQTILDNILSNPRYNVQIANTNYTNLNSYGDIRFAYSLARGYRGRVNSLNNNTPSYLSPSSTTTGLSVGNKIKVAVVDSGVLTNHVDLVGNISSNLTNTNLAYNYCASNSSSPYCNSGNTYIQNNPNPTFNLNPNAGGDATAWHGTFVAGVIGGTYSATNVGVMGIAPESEIIPYRVTFDNGTFVPNYYIGEAFKSAADANAVVINNSYGLPTLDEDGNHTIDASDISSQSDLVYIYRDSNTTPYTSNYINQMLDAVANKDVIFVWAAGNDGTAQPGVESSIPLFFNEFKDGEYYKNFINVVAYDSNAKTIANYSNRCGVSKEYCLTAPGTNIISISSGDSSTKNSLYSLSSGTSFAAPMVSGAVAVIKGAFPYLTGAEITKLLFITARDLGEPGVDDVYGWGMLDLERATRPVGATLVPIDSRINRRAMNLSSSNIQLNSVMANSIKSKNLKFVVLDSFNRTFNMNLNDYIDTKKSRTNTIDILNKFGGNRAKSLAINGDKSFNLYYNTETNTKSVSQEVELSYSINSRKDNDYGFNLYYGSNPYNAFVNDKIDFYNNYSLSSAYGYNVLNPYFKSDSSRNFAFNNLKKINDKINLNFGFLYQNYTMDYEQTYKNRKKDEDLGSAFSLLGGMTYNFTKNINAKIEVGILNEYETFFGTKWNGAFGIGENNLTYMASIQNNINMFSNKISLFGRANFGYTKANRANDSLVNDISGLYSNSFALGLNYNFDNDYMGQKSNISLLLTQPVKINSGNFKISLPFARDNEGNIYYASHKINFKDDDEVNLQLAYNYSVENDSSFNVGFIYRNYLENEYIMLLKYRKAFNF